MNNIKVHILNWMMTGILTPTKGEILISGVHPYEKRREHAKNIGVVFGQRSQLWWLLPVIESYKVLKEIYRINDDIYNKNLKMFEQLVDIKSLYAKPVRQLSLGQRMLCEVIAAFLHDPKVVFLDEPTIGLDVSIKDKIRSLIKHLNEEKNTTIVLTSHDTRDLEELCKRVVIIDKGTLIFDNDLENLKSMFGKYRTLKVRVRGSENTKENIDKYLNTKFQNEEYSLLDSEDDMISININEHKVLLTDVLGYLLKIYSLDDVQIEDVGVESVIKKIYEGEAR